MNVRDDPELLTLIEAAEESISDLTYLLSQDDDGLDFGDLEHTLLAVCDQLVAVRNELRAALPVAPDDPVR